METKIVIEENEIQMAIRKMVRRELKNIVNDELQPIVKNLLTHGKAKDYIFDAVQQKAEGSVDEYFRRYQRYTIRKALHDTLDTNEKAFKDGVNFAEFMNAKDNEEVQDRIIMTTAKVLAEDIKRDRKLFDEIKERINE